MADKTRLQEAASQIPVTRFDIDGRGIGKLTNTEAIAALPRNASGQIVIDKNGKIVGT